MVVFEDGLPKKRDYRRFNIANTTDDTDSIYQVLTRRLAYLDTDEAPKEGDKFAYRPQLLLIDGGQPQVAAAQRALDDAGVGEITITGIAKRLEELWLPDDDFPVILPRSSEALFLVQRLRDEAHRFAITAQRKSRSRDIRSQLADVPGLGPARIRELLKHFGSVKRLRAAGEDELLEVSGIGKATAAAIRTALSAGNSGGGR
jgi:excinuclease ABC subunit C